ncbi:MAG: hypothetical protein CL627_10150 [Aurantimonas sp.]|nr:hypothetical protein [Aurantimonas sp.]
MVPLWPDRPASLPGRRLPVLPTTGPDDPHPTPAAGDACPKRFDGTRGNNVNTTNDNGFGHLPARRMLDGRHRRSCTGSVPTPKGGGLVPFESLLEGDLILRAASDPDVVAVRAQPETFRWLDGVSGRRRRYTPDLLVTLRDGSKVYREVKPYALLVRDPELRGRRRRIEAECLARGAKFEIWTEYEIRETPDRPALLRAATLEEARRHAVALAEPFAAGGAQLTMAPAYVRELASLISLADIRRVDEGWIGRSGLTGILTALFCDLVTCPRTRMVVWARRPEVDLP